MNDNDALENLAQKGREALRYLETDTALQIYKDALEIDDSFIDGWVGLGQVYYEMGKLKQADQAYQQALDLVKKQLGKSWQEKKLTWQQNKNKPIIRLVHGLGLLSYRQGKIKEAQKWFELEHNLDPKLDAPLTMLDDIKSGRKFTKLKYQNLEI
jgi:tetratricopeptide (TPR) repeat protein